MKRFMIVLIVLLGAQMLFGQPWDQDNSVFNPSGIPSLTFSQPRFADLDGDGDFDFLLGNINGAPIFIKNIGSVSAPDFQVSSGVTDGISSLDAEMGVCADMDGDGDLDLICGGYTGLNYFVNNGTVTAPQFVEVPGYFSGLAVGENPVPDLADVDNDGDNDLVVGLSESGNVLLYTNIGSASAGQFSQAQMLFLGDVGLYAYPVFCDLDHDNDQDILMGRDSHGFIYYQNEGTAASGNWQPEITSFPGLGMEDYWNSPDLVDLNNDGKFDLIFGTASGPLQYYVNTGTASTPVWQVNTTLFGGVLDVGGASSPVFYDFDADGDLDLISGSQMGNIKYFENTGTDHSPAWAEDSAYFSSIDHSIYAAVAIGDVNHDNLPDAIVGDLNGHLFYHRNTGTGFVYETAFLTDAVLGGWSVPRLLDIDGDGDLDIAAGNEAGNLVLFENTGTPRNPVWTGVTGYFGGIDVGSQCSPCFGDIDGDGDFDFVAGNIVGGLVCYLRQANTWVANPSYVTGITTDQNAAPALVDLDHDGDLDLVVGDYDGTLSYYRNLLYSGTTLNPPANLTAEVSGDILLIWSPPVAGSTSPFEHYNVYLNGVPAGETSELSWIFTDLPGGLSYTAEVTAQYVAGESTPISTSWTANNYNPPVDLAFQLLHDQIRLSWSPPQGSTFGVDFYRVYVDEVLDGETPDLFYFIEEVEADVTYHIGITALYSDGTESDPAVMDITFVANEDELMVPLALSNYPNPFTPETTIAYSLKQGCSVCLEIFNARGQKVRTLVNETKAQGAYSILWNGCDDRGDPLPGGVYLYRVRAGKDSETRKMVLLR